MLHNAKIRSVHTKGEQSYELLGLVLAFTDTVLKTILMKLLDDGLAYERVAEYSATIEEPFASDHSMEGKVVNGDLVYIWREVAIK